MNLIANEKQMRNDASVYYIYQKLEGVLQDDPDAILYYNFPVYKGDIAEDNVVAKLLLLSPSYGLFYFDTFTTGDDAQIVQDRCDNIYQLITGKLKKNSSLRSGRDKLRYDLSTIVVSEDKELNLPEEDHVCSINTLSQTIHEYASPIKEDVLFKTIQSCVDGTQSMIKKVERKNCDKGTKGDILNQIQEQLTVFDIEQKAVALLDVDGPQRLRGLAGSGKTIVLAQKAAIYHLNHPDDLVLYTYYTKALHDTVKEHIERAYKFFSDNQTPNWEKIIVCHSWGSSDTPGVYSMACEDNNIKRLDFREAASKNRKDPFGEVCDMLIKSDTISPKYDLILIDEGQDFTPPFYQLCYKLSKNRKIVWAYDDFQNIFDVDIQDEKLTFGSENGEPSVDFDSSDNSNQDIVLKKCYRTPRIQLIAAFSLGLGIYNDKVLQCIDSKQLWESLGFEVLKGNCVTGDSMEIIRPENNTPQISNKIFKYSSFQTISCHDIVHECMEIAKCITRDVTEENLLPTDICVICLDKKNVHEYFDKIEGYLMRDDIRCFNLLNVVNSNISFTRDGCVTLTTVNKAKGNEKGAVYICGVDYVFSNANNVVLRNMLFTSMTRTKGWLTLTGSGDDFEKCLQEINRLRDNEFKLRFCQPSKEETKTIESNSRKQESAFGSIQQQIDLLKKSGLSIEDIKNRFSRMLDSNHES